MLMKKTLLEKSPDITRFVAQSINISEDVHHAAVGQIAKPQLAVFITHGMGQQVPFETRDSVVEGLAQAAARQGHTVPSIRARTVQIDGLKTQRAEFDMCDARGRDVEVHVYEGYWAPMTEGQVALSDVMWFLLGAGLKGLSNCRLPFERWIFGKAVSFGKQFTAALSLLVIFFVLLSLMVLNFITAVVSGDKFIHHNGDPYFTDAAFVAMTSVVGIYVVACIALVASFTILKGCRKWIQYRRKSTVWKMATAATQLLMWLWLAMTIVGAITLLLLAAGWLQPEYVSSAFISKYWLPIWVSLLITSWIVKKILVQYMGDVAIYIDSHSLDCFNDIRTRIKTRVFEQAKAVYSNKQYERIAMVGHSLGSVITYDTLNALINHDQLNGKALNVTERTALMLTFGSQKDGTTATREALAASLQPLIQAYIPMRNIKWINIFSPRDIVSGKLEFYDDPKASGYTPQRAVKNVEDMDAMIPLVAHTEYWQNTTLFDELYVNI